MISVGRVIRPQGNRGEVVIAPETDFGTERFGPGAELCRLDDGAVKPLRVAESREMRGRWVVAFEGISSIDAAERLRDAELRIPAEALHALGESTYYVHDLVGCEVRTAAGGRVGSVERVELATTPPLLVVCGPPAEGEVLVPLVETICRRVDIAARRIEIDPPDGLIELNRPGSGS
jgi:16S rRNA processing protein RimM